MVLTYSIFWFLFCLTYMIPPLQVGLLPVLSSCNSHLTLDTQTYDILLAPPFTAVTLPPFSDKILFILQGPVQLQNRNFFDNVYCLYYLFGSFLLPFPAIFSHWLCFIFLTRHPELPEGRDYVLYFFDSPQHLTQD